MNIEMRNPAGIKKTGRVTKLILTAENVAEQQELAALAVILSRGQYPGTAQQPDDGHDYPDTMSGCDYPICAE